MEWNKANTEEENKRMAFQYELCDACSRGEFWKVKNLIKKGADPRGSLEFGSKCFTLAVSARVGITFLKYLLDHGSNIHHDNDQALKRACEIGDKEIVEFLIANGADPSVADYRVINERKFLKACKYRESDNVKRYLTECGVKSSFEHLYLAIVSNSLETISLVWEGIDKNEIGIGYGLNPFPLINACKYGNLDVIEFFINKGVDVNAGYNHDKGVINPLQTAIYYGNFDVVKLLVSHGATFPNAYEYAKECYKWEIMEFLKNGGSVSREEIINKIQERVLKELKEFTNTELKDIWYLQKEISFGNDDD
jgi:ankyrin repeat protein